MTAVACGSSLVGEAPVCGESPTFTRILDSTLPTFTVPANITITKAADCTYDALPNITGDVTDEADNCTSSGGLNATYADVVLPGVCEGQEIITRYWTLTDNCGNSTVKQQTIIIADNILAPTFTVPGEITINRGADCNYDASPSVTGNVTDAADNCTAVPIVTYSESIIAGTCAGEEIIIRTWTVSDRCGNPTQKIQNIIVRDITNPVISQQASNQTAECTGSEPENNAAYLNWLNTQGGGTATDVCGSGPLSWTNNAVTQSGLLTDAQVPSR